VRRIFILQQDVLTMKSYVYKARDASGTIKSGVISAESRGVAFQNLKDQGLVPISVTEQTGAVSHYPGWFRSFTIKLSAGILLLLVGGFAIYSYISSKKAQAPFDNIARREVQIPKQPVATQSFADASSAIPLPQRKLKSSPELGLESLPTQPNEIHIIPSEIEVKPKSLKPKKRVVSDLRPGKTNSLPSGLSSATERILNTLISSPLGGPPPPLLRLPNNEAENLLDVLNRDIIVFADDDPEMVAKKENLAAAKQILKEYIKDGGKPEEFMAHYRAILVKASEERNDLQKEFWKLVNAGNLAEAEKFYNDANTLLSEEGSLLLRLPPQLKNKEP